MEIYQVLCVCVLFVFFRGKLPNFLSSYYSSPFFLATRTVIHTCIHTDTHKFTDCCIQYYLCTLSFCFRLITHTHTHTCKSTYVCMHGLTLTYLFLLTFFRCKPTHTLIIFLTSPHPYMCLYSDFSSFLRSQTKVKIPLDMKGVCTHTHTHTHVCNYSCSNICIHMYTQTHSIIHLNTYTSFIERSSFSNREL